MLLVSLGAVGQVAGQLFKHVHGCKVIGSVGSGDKVRCRGHYGMLMFSERQNFILERPSWYRIVVSEENGCRALDMVWVQYHKLKFIPAAAAPSARHKGCLLSLLALHRSAGCFFIARGIARAISIARAIARAIQNSF